MKVAELKSRLVTIAVVCLAASSQAADPVQGKLDQALIAKVRRGAAGEVERLLEKGANPNAKSGLASALQDAASGDHLKIMQMLIDRGADVNAVAPDGTSPLVAAAKHRTNQASKLLLDAGAKPTPAALAKACWLNREATVTLLLEAGVSPDGGMASAAQGGHAKLLRQLLARGADVDAKSRDGNTALHTGALQGGVDVVRLLLDHRADPNAINDRGQTPLHMAIGGDGLVENVRMLLEAGANVNLRDNELASPIRHAAMRGHIAAYNMLREASDGEEQPGINPQDTTLYESQKTTEQLIGDTRSKDNLVRKHALLALVARGAAIMPELLKAFESQPEHEALYEVFVRIGPAAEVALPRLAEMLADKRRVVIARNAMDQIKPGHFAQLPPPVRAQADTALYNAVIEPESRQIAGFFASWLSEPSRLKLLRSKESEHRALAVRIMKRPGPWSPQLEAELIKLLLSNDEQLDIRGDAARALGASGRLSQQGKAALLEILMAAPPYVENLSPAERRRQTQLQALAKSAGRALGVAGPAIIDELLPLMTPLDNHLRPGAMEAWFGLGSAGVPRLVELLANPDEAIAISASVALNRIGQPAVPALIKALASENAQVVDQALSALWWIGPTEDAIGAVLAIVSAENRTDRTRIAAARTGLKIGPRNHQVKQEIMKALPALIRVFQGEDVKCQVWVAEVLGQVGSAATPALPALRAFLARRELSEATYAAKRAIQLIDQASAP